MARVEALKSPLTELLRHGADRSDRSPGAVAISVLLHGAVAAGIVYASLHVVTAPEPKTIRVLLPPSQPGSPPPPAPPKGIRRRERPPQVVPEKRPVETRIVAPPEIPATLPEPATEPEFGDTEVDDDGTADGVKDGFGDGPPWSDGIGWGDELGPGFEPPLIIVDRRQARLIREVKPIYPRPAIIAGVQGAVVLDAIIDVDGTVKEVVVLRGHALLQRAAIEAVRQWLFAPATHDGRPARMRLTVTVDFRIER